jgi:hypothetical protein
MLERIRRVQFDSWLHAVGQRDDFDATDADLLDPGRRHIRRMPDDELAELARSPASKLGQLAASEMRSRESWRGPGRWSLIVASLALLASLAAITRTF